MMWRPEHFLLQSLSFKEGESTQVFPPKHPQVVGCILGYFFLMVR